MKGVWMWPDSISRHGAYKCVSYLSRAGITDIFFLTKGLSGKTSFHGKYAPHFSDRDLLKELIFHAHNASVRVHAWFTSASDEYYKSVYPLSGRCHFSKGRDKGLISLTDGAYLRYMESIVSETASYYDIDGLHLDYIRYNHILYGWSDNEIRQYESEGADILRLKELVNRTFYTKEDENAIFDSFRNGDPSVLAFSNARRNNVNAFAKRLTEAAKETKPNLILSCALMPEGAYDDKAFSDLHYGQNYKDLSEIFDFALPMAYSKAYEKDSAWVKEVYEKTKAYGFRTITGLHAYQGGTRISLESDISSLLGAEEDSFCLFREGTFVYAFNSGNSVSVYNPTEKRVLIADTENPSASPVAIEPGEEIRLSPDFSFRCIFEDETEAPVFSVPEKTVSAYPSADMRRIAEMEEIFENVSSAYKAFSESFSGIRDVQGKLKTLIGYYESGLWLKDYTDDEEGRVPAGMKKGVLSQDGIDSLLYGIGTLKEEISAFFRESVLD